MSFHWWTLKIGVCDSLDLASQNTLRVSVVQYPLFIISILLLFFLSLTHLCTFFTAISFVESAAIELLLDLNVGFADVLIYP